MSERLNKAQNSFRVREENGYGSLLPCGKCACLQGLKIKANTHHFDDGLYTVGMRIYCG